MQEQRINFETAKLAKEKGFHWKSPVWGVTNGGQPTLSFEGETGDEYNNPCFSEEGREITPKYYHSTNAHYPRPTQGLLAKWLRERHKMHLLCGPVDMGQWECFIFNMEGRSIDQDSPDIFESHEESMEACLQQALNLIKSTQ